MEITSVFICPTNGISVNGKFGINGAQYHLHIDQIIHEDKPHFTLSLFEDGSNVWYRNQNPKINFGEFNLLSLNMKDTLQLAGLAMSGETIQREIKEVA